ATVQYRTGRLTVYALTTTGIYRCIAGTAACKHRLKTVTVYGGVVCYATILYELAALIVIFIIAAVLQARVNGGIIRLPVNQLRVVVADNHPVSRLSDRYGGLCRQCCTRGQSGNGQCEYCASTLSFCFCQF